MCGIIGEISREKPIDVEVFNKSRDLMYHRGPDGCGTEVLSENKVALGHRRLSIIDLSENGRQPMSNEDGSIWITFNGEIYNFPLLKKQLINLGHSFKSDSDTEVIVHGYEEWGMEGILSRLNGMFAFGLWDQNSQTLYIARDRFGIKPLYYYKNNSGLIFSSELKGIVGNKDVPRELDFSSVNDFFVYRFIPAPKSIWKNIFKLEPATYITYKPKEHTLFKKKYWEIETGGRYLKENEFLEAFWNQLNQSVDEHLISDVPVGIFLSGGYDSTTLTHLTHKQGHHLNSFSIGFKGWKKSEHYFARQVANQLQTKHHEAILSPDHLEVLPRLSYYYDEPLGGSSFLPTYLVSKFARENNIKVVLGGDGGDELLGGYRWHKAVLQNLNRLKQLKSLLSFGLSKNGAVDIENLVAGYYNKMSWADYNYLDANQLFNGNIPQNELPNDYWLYRKIVNPNLSALKNLQIIDYKTFMVDVVLTKVDRASMANSVEVRVPFLDYKLNELIMSLEEKVYFKPQTFKYPLKHELEKHFSDEIVNKPKSGFGSPLHKKHTGFFINSIRENKKLMEMLDLKIFNGLTGNNRKLWALYIFSNWVNEWL